MSDRVVLIWGPGASPAGEAGWRKRRDVRRLIEETVSGVTVWFPEDDAARRWIGYDGPPADLGAYEMLQFQRADLVVCLDVVGVPLTIASEALSALVGAVSRGVRGLDEFLAKFVAVVRTDRYNVILGHQPHIADAPDAPQSLLWHQLGQMLQRFDRLDALRCVPYTRRTFAACDAAREVARRVSDWLESP